MKESKEEANYRKASDGDRSCDTCFYMHDDGTCGKVMGQVKPTMVCDEWMDT